MSANNSSPTPNNWPAILLFLAAIGVPGAAALKFADTISKNPWQAIAIALLYELCLLFLAFLRRVWEQLQDAWSKDTATWVNNLVEKKWFSYGSYYARFLTFQHRDFDIKGLSTQSIYTLELEQVFVDLSIDPKPIHQVLANPIPSQVPQALRAGSHSLWEYLEAKPLKHQHLVIVGAPGSGKTTLLKHLALTFVSPKKRRTLSRSIQHAYQLPFLLFLREHTEEIYTKPDFSLVDAIQISLSRWDRPVPEGWVRRQLSKGKCLILLDGLDEVADATLREEVVEWVQEQMKKYAPNRFLVSSRPFGYRSNPLSGVMLLDVRPFTFEQIERFVHNWYRANEIMSSQKDDPGVRMRAKTDAQNLVRRIQQTPALSSMAVNPLLLTMIATIHRYRSTLPGKRVELYAEICEVFLGKRQQARGMKIDLRPAQCVSVLQPLAYAMMLQEQREITAHDAQEAIKDALKLVDEQMKPANFLQMVEHMSGLLLEREPGIYNFAHLTFQEYLAATYIREQGVETTLTTHVGESWWAETTRLYCAQTDATNVIEACHNHVAPSIDHLMLALECYEEALKVQPVVKSQVDKLIERGVENPDSRQRRVIAETLLRRRLKEMVLVREGVYRDTSLILCAEYQLFLDEQRVQGKYYQPDQWMDTRFPSGQALLPVLGVRPSAVQAFCDWLTKREQEGWWYHLPGRNEYKLEEASVRPAWLPPCAWDVPHGYWRQRSYWQDDDVFEWIRQPVIAQTVPVLQEQVAPLNLDMLDSSDRILKETSAKVIGWDEFSNYLALALDLVRDLDLARALARALDLSRSLASVHDLDVAILRALALALDLARACDLTLTFLSSHDLKLTRDPTPTHDLARAFANTHDLALALTRDLARAFANTHDLALALTRDRALASDSTSDLASDLTRAHDFSNEFIRARDFAINLVFASLSIFGLDRIKDQRTSHFLDLALLLALLSICMSFCVHELAIMLPASSSQSFWESLFARLKKKRELSLEEDLQHTLGIGIEVYHQLERLDKRRQGEELACEGILIIKERKEV